MQQNHPLQTLTDLDATSPRTAECRDEPGEVGSLLTTVGVYAVTSESIGFHLAAVVMAKLVEDLAAYIDVNPVEAIQARTLLLTWLKDEANGGMTE